MQTIPHVHIHLPFHFVATARTHDKYRNETTYDARKITHS